LKLICGGKEHNQAKISNLLLWKIGDLPFNDQHCWKKFIGNHKLEVSLALHWDQQTKTLSYEQHSHQFDKQLKAVTLLETLINRKSMALEDWAQLIGEDVSDRKFYFRWWSYVERLNINFMKLCGYKGLRLNRDRLEMLLPVIVVSKHP
ncbi:MAG: hypothetical protein WCG27_11595, partial [Pseudomonadota bacterium]